MFMTDRYLDLSLCVCVCVRMCQLFRACLLLVSSWDQAVRAGPSRPGCYSPVLYIKTWSYHCPAPTTATLSLQVKKTTFDLIVIKTHGFSNVL